MSCVWIIAHTWKSVLTVASFICMNHGTHAYVIRVNHDTHIRRMHESKNHDTPICHVYELWHTLGGVLAPDRMSHGTQMNESWYTDEWVTRRPKMERSQLKHHELLFSRTTKLNYPAFAGLNH